MTTETIDAPAPAGGDSTRHPPAIWFFFWGEFAERSSYYGMRAILLLYMTDALKMATTKAGSPSSDSLQCRGRPGRLRC